MTQTKKYAIRCSSEEEARECMDIVEERRDIKWYEWKYIVSNKWKISSVDRYIDDKWWLHHWNWKEKSQVVNSWYLAVWLSNKSIYKIYKVHRLVAEAFIPNPDKKRCINHKDWNKFNNNIENLERCTYSENSIHKNYVLKNGMVGKFWVNHPASKKVNQYSIDMEFIKERECIRMVETKLWINKSNIADCCRWKNKRITAGWYKRKYV